MMRSTAELKRASQDPIHGLHSRFSATMQNIGTGAPNQQQHITLIGTLMILRQHNCDNGRFAGQAGEERRECTDLLLQKLAGLNPSDPQTWHELRDKVLAVHTLLR